MSKALQLLMRRSERVSRDEVQSVGRKAFRSDAISDYYEQKAESEAEKKSHREHAACFFFKYGQEISGRRCFSMPGKHWKFETLMLNFQTHKPRWKHICVERCLTTMEQGYPYAPTSNSDKFCVVPDSTGLIKAGNKKVKIVNTSVHGLMHMISTSQMRSDEFGRWGAFWWDLQGPLTLELAKMISLLPKCIHKEADVIPFCLTFMNGRDSVRSPINTDSAEHRAELVCRQITGRHFSAEMQSVCRYRSANGANMAVAFCLMRRV